MRYTLFYIAGCLTLAPLLLCSCTPGYGKEDPDIWQEPAKKKCVKKDPELVPFVPTGTYMEGLYIYPNP